MWGESGHDGGEVQRAGITPTYVGRIAFALGLHSLDKDHPHVCGENSIEPKVKCKKLGSPPRMWGELQGPPRRLCYPRITPTYVGRITAA